jgi:acyl-coenzyme A synthetase/AMP-(fatty) acid ligase
MHGEAVVAFVRTCAPLTEAEVLSHCRRKLASYKVPGRVFFLDELPRTPSGKIARQRLREIHGKLR